MGTGIGIFLGVIIVFFLIALGSGGEGGDEYWD